MDAVHNYNDCMSVCNQIAATK